MAVNGLNGNHQQNVEQSQTNPNMGNIRLNSSDYGNSLGFGSKGLSLMSLEKGSEYTEAIAAEISAVFAKGTGKFKPKVTAINKENTSGLAYSSVVVSSKDNNKVRYFIILLEATGRKPLTAKEIIDEYVMIERTGNVNGIPIYTSDDAFDGIYYVEVVNALRQEYPGVNEFGSSDGVVLGYIHPDIQQVAPVLAGIAYNACSVNHDLWVLKNDLNIDTALSDNNNRNKILKIGSEIGKSVRANSLGRPVRTDWLLSLDLIDTNKNSRSINQQNTTSRITMVGGYIDAIPEQVLVPVPYGTPAKAQTRLHPNIIITTSQVIEPTLGHLLLAIGTSATMLNQSMWLAPLRLEHNKVSYGSLNILANLENSETGIGARMSFDPKKNYKPEEIFEGLRNMFSLTPILSMDIESFGISTSYSSAFPAAAKAIEDGNKEAAAKMIIKTASWLTSGRFPDNFPTNQIFNNEGIVIPLGTFNDNKAERDIREIDLAFIASKASDDEVINLVNRWTRSNAPKSLTGMDPFMTKVDIINRLIPSAEITGKAVRVTFTAYFIKTLVDAISASGLSARYEPAIKYVENTGIDIIPSFLSNASINGVTGFGHEAMQTGPFYSTMYPTSGFGIVQ